MSRQARHEPQWSTSGASGARRSWSFTNVGVATVIANPFASMQVSDRIRPRQLAQDAPMLTIAAGLAMRSFE